MTGEQCKTVFRSKLIRQPPASQETLTLLRIVLNHIETQGLTTMYHHMWNTLHMNHALLYKH